MINELKALRDEIDRNGMMPSIGYDWAARLTRIIQQAESVEPVMQVVRDIQGVPIGRVLEGAAGRFDAGDKLYTHPPLHRDASELVEALKRLKYCPLEAVYSVASKALANWESRDE